MKKEDILLTALWLVCISLLWEIQSKVSTQYDEGITFSYWIRSFSVVWKIFLWGTTGGFPPFLFYKTIKRKRNKIYIEV